MGAPDVSVIIPTKDRPEWLARAVSSVARQENIVAELLVVDDGSRRPVPGDFPGPQAITMQVLRHSSSQGQARARNAGIAAARGRWVAFHDDDDLWSPQKLHMVVNAAERAGTTFAYSDGVVVDARGTVLSASPAPTATGSALHRLLLQSNVIPCGSSNIVCRADVARYLGGFDEDLSTVVDWDFNIRLAANETGVAVREPLVAYTVHADNAHLDERSAFADLGRLEAKHAVARLHAGVDIDREWWLKWRASTHRASGDRRRAASAYIRLGARQRDASLVARGVVLGLAGPGPLRVARRLRPAPGPSSRPGWLDLFAPVASC